MDRNKLVWIRQFIYLVFCVDRRVDESDWNKSLLLYITSRLTCKTDVDPEAVFQMYIIIKLYNFTYNIE